MAILRDRIDDVARNISRNPLVEIIRGIRNLKIHFIVFVITDIKIMVTTQKISLKFCKMNCY